MANLAAVNTIDTANTDGNCIYGAEPLGGSPQKSANVKFNQQNVEYYWSGSTLDDVTAVKVNPFIPVPCQPGIRTILPTVNTTVFINGKLPAVTGDNTSIGGTPRPLTGPFQHVNIIIGQKL